MIEIKFTFTAPTCAKIDDECECVLCMAQLADEENEKERKKHSYDFSWGMTHEDDNSKYDQLWQEANNFPTQNALWEQEQVEAQLAEQEAEYQASRAEELAMMAQMRGY